MLIKIYLYHIHMKIKENFHWILICCVKHFLKKILMERHMEMLLPHLQLWASFFVIFKLFIFFPFLFFFSVEKSKNLCKTQFYVTQKCFALYMVEIKMNLINLCDRI